MIDKWRYVVWQTNKHVKPRNTNDVVDGPEIGPFLVLNLLLFACYLENLLTLKPTQLWLYAAVYSVNENFMSTQ